MLDKFFKLSGLKRKPSKSSKALLFFSSSWRKFSRINKIIRKYISRVAKTRTKLTFLSLSLPRTIPLSDIRTRNKEIVSTRSGNERWRQESNVSNVGLKSVECEAQNGCNTNEEGSIVQMFRKQRFTGVIGGKLAPIQPLVSSLSPSLSKTNDSTLLDVPVIYTSAPDTLCLRSLFHRCYAVCVCGEQQEVEGKREGERERSTEGVSFHFISSNETKLLQED